MSCPISALLNPAEPSSSEERAQADKVHSNVVNPRDNAQGARNLRGTQNGPPGLLGSHRTIASRRSRPPLAPLILASSTLSAEEKSSADKSQSNAANPQPGTCVGRNAQGNQSNVTDPSSPPRATVPGRAKQSAAVLKDPSPRAVLRPVRNELILDVLRKRQELRKNAEAEAARKKNFDIFNAIIQRTDLIIDFAAQLEFEDLISLYAISRDFHSIISARFTTVLMRQAVNKAPESARIFHFKAYKSLCMPDPALRPHPDIPDETRLIPSFRWLRMVLYREQVVDEIIDILRRAGHRMPERTSLTIKRIWLTMDVPTTVKRIGLFHNTNFWTDLDLWLATLFFVKLDMHFNHPLDFQPSTALRSLLIGQRSLTTLWKTLKRTALTNEVEAMQMLVRFAYRPDPQFADARIFGVPPAEIGAGIREGWGAGQGLLMRIDDLVLREASRREQDVTTQILNMMIWGYTDFSALEAEAASNDKKDDTRVEEEVGNTGEDIL